MRTHDPFHGTSVALSSCVRRFRHSLQPRMSPMKLTSLVPLAASIAVLGALAGCEDSTGPRDRVPPAAPRGLYSMTGDHEAVLHWIDNTESDLAGYRIYAAPCATGSACPYDQVGTNTGTTFTVSGLSNGGTPHFA